MRLSWIFSLPPADRIRCARDLAAAVRRGELVWELRSWRETVTAAAAGLDLTELEWLDIDNAVGRP